MVSTCQLQVPTNYQDVTQGDTTMPIMLVPWEISFQIQVLTSKLEIAFHCDILFPIPLKQMS